MDELTPNTRLSVFLKHKKISQSRLAEMLATSQPTVSAILSGARKLSRGMSARISSIFPELSADWLLYGEGEMLKQPQGPGLVRTEGDFSPASGTGDVSVSGCDALLSERVKALERQIAEKDARIADLKDTIEILKSSRIK